MIRIRSLLAAMAGAVAAAFVAAAPAHAVAGATATVGGDGNLHHSGVAGVINVVALTKTGTTVEIDDSVTVTAGGACEYVNDGDDTRYQGQL